MAMQATAAEGRPWLERQGQMSAGGGRIWLLYAAGWLNDAVRPSWSVADCPIIEDRTHTMSVSAIFKKAPARGGCLAS